MELARADRRPESGRTFAVHGRPGSPRLRWFLEGLERAMAAHSHRLVPDAGPGTGVVFHLLDPERPRPFRRRSSATFVVAVAEVRSAPGDVLRAAYPLLIRALANLLIYVVNTDDAFQVHMVTLEQGTYRIDAGGGDGEFFDRVYQRVAPLATARLIIDNRFLPDLPPALWGGDEGTRALYRAGGKLAAMNLLPAPFPIQELLPERDFRHVQRLYGIGGLSYGNLSTRRCGNEFWMSASGVDKADLRLVGEHVLLVRDFDAERGAMVLSVPPGIRPRRVSVDAIEHWLIYREHPGVGAIVHIHAWMEGVPSTAVNYPCGTLELAQAVAELVRAAPDPARAVIGLKNHGLTITGPDLDEIFARIEGKVQPQVPMS